jgi:hypothetical protein
LSGEHILGSSAAAALVRVGLGHDEVVRALVREVGITTEEAEAAWRFVTEGSPQAVEKSGDE